jgi:hypothetical protein
MRDRLIQHDFLVPFALGLPVVVGLVIWQEQLGLSDGLTGWLVVFSAIPIVLLHEWMYERGRGRLER